MTRRFVLHYIEMVAVMLVGMVVLAPLWMPFGIERADLRALTMAVDMTVAMVAWMRWRGHGWRPVAEMAAAMVVPFLLLLGPLWAGVLSEDGLMLYGHGLMLAAMLGVMLLRPAEYAGHRHRPQPGRTESWRPSVR